jgi:hypothetical protein
MTIRSAQGEGRGRSLYLDVAGVPAVKVYVGALHLERPSWAFALAPVSLRYPDLDAYVQLSCPTRAASGLGASMHNSARGTLTGTETHPVAVTELTIRISSSCGTLLRTAISGSLTNCAAEERQTRCRGHARGYRASTARLVPWTALCGNISTTPSDRTHGDPASGTQGWG